jgi:hypothetical protein
LTGVQPLLAQLSGPFRIPVATTAGYVAQWIAVSQTGMPVVTDQCILWEFA